MTVKELLEKLEGVNPEASVCIRIIDDGDYYRLAGDIKFAYDYRTFDAPKSKPKSGKKGEEVAMLICEQAEK